MTKEERKREYMKEYRQKNKEKIAEYKKQYYLQKSEEILEQKKQYYQEKRKQILERQKRYQQENKEEIIEYRKQYYQENKEKFAEHNKQYKQTPMGRAHNLVSGYKREDRKHGRGECTLTAKWIMENIFNKPCAHCSKSGWQIIGCNRLDNSRPHTPDNVEPCCFEHNNELNGVEMSKKVYQYTLAGELVKVWESTAECGRNGYNSGNVCFCCNGRLDKYKGYKWKYKSI